MIERLVGNEQNPYIEIELRSIVNDIFLPDLFFIIIFFT